MNENSLNALGIPLYSGRQKKIPFIEADDLTSMSVKVARNPEQFPISRVIALRKYFDVRFHCSISHNCRDRLQCTMCKWDKNIEATCMSVAMAMGNLLRYFIFTSRGSPLVS